MNADYIGSDLIIGLDVIRGFWLYVTNCKGLIPPQLCMSTLPTPLECWDWQPARKSVLHWIIQQLGNMLKFTESASISISMHPPKGIYCVT